MNSICSNCKKKTTFILDQDTIQINCQCGNNSSMSIIDFLNEYKSQNHMINEIKIAYDHLLNYFTTLKNDTINQLHELIAKIESSYADSFYRNKSQLFYFLQAVINKDPSNDTNNTVFLYQCKKHYTFDDVIKYYTDYTIIQKKRYEDMKSIRVIREHACSVQSLLLLKDGKVASCSLDQTIKIYDPYFNYCCVKTLERHNDCINSICQLDDGTIVSCSKDHSIIIGDFTIEYAHGDEVFKIITLPNNRIASSSKYLIKIWNTKPPSIIPIKVLRGHDDTINSLLYIKEKDILISGSIDWILRLWNMSTYQCQTVIYRVECRSRNALYQIDGDRVIVGGNKKFYIVNIDKCVIEKIVKDTLFGKVNCFLKLKDNKTILCGCDEGKFCFYDMNTGKYNTPKKMHDRNVYDLLAIDDNKFLSCSWDKTIKLWEY